MHTNKNRYRPLLIAAVALAAVTGPAAAVRAQSPAEYQKPPAASPAAGDPRQVFIATVHLDGNATISGDAKHPAEPAPTAPLPAGGGLLLTPPDASGAWRMRAFVFEPRQVVVFQGEPVTLAFVGVQGPSHRIQVDGLGEIIELKRGEVKTVTVAADAPGTIGFRSLDRLPSMQGNVIVLPRP